MNRIILWHNFSLFVGVNPVAIRTHSHPVIQFVVATSTPFKSKNEHGIWKEKRGLLISPNYDHACDARNVEIVSLEIDTESSLGEWITGHYLNGHEVIEYPSDTLPLLNIEMLFEQITQQNWEAISSSILNYF